MFQLIRTIYSFLSDKIWKIRLDKLDGRRYVLIRQLRVLVLAVKGFNEDKCLLKATALTYYTLFSIVPVIALTFAIARGFGYDKDLQQELMMKFQDQRVVLTSVFQYADNMLASAKGGIIAGVGIVVLLFTVVRLLSNIEISFNEIWEVKRGRTWVRKFTDYLSIMLLSPIFVVLSGSLSVIIQTQFTEVVHFLGLENFSGFLLKLLINVISFALIFSMFTFIYMVLPNIKVSLKAAALAALISAVLFEVVQWAYLYFQISASQYNQIYGSFAALPLFLLWVQISWFIVLFGAELSFAYQNVEHYELENEIQNVSVRYKRILALLILNKVLKNFLQGGKPLTAEQLAHELDLPMRLARSIINDFVQVGILIQVKSESDERQTFYHPALSENQLTVKFVIEKMDSMGVNELPIHPTSEFTSISNIVASFDNTLEQSRSNILVKDIH